jgi:type I restriction enzyme S subunit
VPRSYANGNAMALDSLDAGRVDIRFLARFLEQRGFRDVTTGTSQPQIIAQNIARISVPLPPLPEQRRIAEILDKADALRTKRRAALAQLDSLTQSIFLDMFGDPATNLKRWRTVTLEEVSLGGTEGLKRGPFGGALKKEIFIDSGHKVYEQQHAIYKTFDIGKYFISQSKYLSMRAFAVGPGDFIVSCSGTVGRIYRLPPLAPDGVINQALLRIRIDAAKVAPVFFEKLFESDAFQRTLLGTARGTGIDNFPPMERIRSTATIVPPMSLQREFVARVTQEQELRTSQQTSMQKLEMLFVSIRHRAFRRGL